MKDYKISFCTTCMNRLHHFKDTFPRNLLDNADYDLLEFILLDYNSKDDLENYVKTHFYEYLLSGKLVYYKTTTPEFYTMSHSRNVAFKVATGDIVCNIDADNFTGPGFAKYINQIFNSQGSTFMSTHSNSPDVKNDVLGRICVRKSDFLAIGGYEERMKHYGFDDFDFINRLELHGLAKHTITNPIFLKAITHSNKERLANGVDDQILESVMIRYKQPYESELILLFKTKQFKRATMVNTQLYNILCNSSPKISNKFEFSILEGGWKEGYWNLDKSHLTLSSSTSTSILQYDGAKGAYVSNENKSDQIFYKMKKDYLIEETLFFYNQISNRLIMEENLRNKKALTNINGFGSEILFKNFNENAIII